MTQVELLDHFLNLDPDYELGHYRHGRGDSSEKVVEVDVSEDFEDEDSRLDSLAGIPLGSSEEPFLIRFSHGPRCSSVRGFPVIITAGAKFVNASSEGFGKCVWILQDTPEVEAKVRSLRPGYDSRVFLLSRQDLREAYSMKPDTMKTSMQSVPPQTPIWKRRQNMLGLPLSFGYVVSKSWIELERGPLGSPLMRGAYVDFLNMIASVLNFTISYVPSDGTYGIQEADGSWSGLVGMINRREVDAGANLLGVTNERAKAVQFSNLVTSASMDLWIRPPGGEGSASQYYSSATSLFYMLQPNVWIMYLCTVIVVILLGLFIGIHAERGLETAFSTFGLIINQGASENALHLSSRILFFACLGFGFMFVNVFSARLASTLSVKKVDKEISKIEDLLEHDYNLYVMGDSSHEDYIREYKKSLWDQKVSRSANFHPGDESTLGENFMHEFTELGAAVLIYKGPVAMWIANNPDIGCSMYSVPLGGSSHGAFAMQKNWPYEEAFNFHILKILESGLYG